jgi:hypothetical protein
LRPTMIYSVSAISFRASRSRRASSSRITALTS